MDRRDFLKFLGISSGTAMISSCGVDKANEKIIPYLIPPEQDVYPGKPVFYNTTCTECPANCGLSARVNEKVYDEVRGLFPTKAEGVKGHPVNNGALCPRGQASLFRLYHPKRIQRPMMRDNDGNFRVATWQEAYAYVTTELQAAKEEKKDNLYFSGRTTGTLAGLIGRFCEEMGIERLPEFEIFSHANLRKANEIVFNQPEVPHYHIKDADFLLTVGADILETFVSPVSNAAQYGEAVKNENFTWYHLEPNLSMTGLKATTRLVVNPHSEIYFLAYLLHTLNRSDIRKRRLSSAIMNMVPDPSAEEVSQKTGISAENLENLVSAFSIAKRPLIITGGVSTAQPGGLEAALLTALIQAAMGMTDTVVNFTHSQNYEKVGSMLDVEALMERLGKKEVGILFITRSNPVDDIPANFNFVEKLKNARLRVGMSDFMSASMQECDVVLPLSHSLESWGDAAPRKGIRNIIQPTIEPQYDTRTEGDVLLEIMRTASGQEQGPDYNQYLIEQWHSLYGESETVSLIENGYIEEPVSPLSIAVDTRSVESYLKNTDFSREVAARPVLIITPSIRTYDGRSKVLPLLNEIPDPLTTVTYGEWVSVSAVAAKKMGLKDRDEIQISVENENLNYPVKVQNVLPDNVYMVQRGLIYAIKTDIDSRSGEASWYLDNISATKTGAVIPLPILSGSMHEEGRGILSSHESVVEHSEHYNEKLKEEVDVEEERMYPKHPHKNYRWGMTINQDSCINCAACVAACYVENNIPVVGKKEQLQGREMSWIRIEPFVRNDRDIEFTLMLCQQCDNAPCEPVCPVYATYHNPEGLNVQVYNRCVGTRYCSNNCPYKVRRFNWFDHRLPKPWDKMYNPALSVRGRGIMEKCTFCVQRIRAAEDMAKDENRLVRDGEVVTACQETCPTKAITFGNLMDDGSRVAQIARSDEAYRVLEELGTEPAIHYLRKEERKNEA